MRWEEVAGRLQSLGRAGQKIRLVVAHSEQECSDEEQEMVPDVMDVSALYYNIFRVGGGFAPSR